MRQRLLNNIKSYNDLMFDSLREMLRNAFVFKHLDSKTLEKISYLFRQERHLKGNVLIRKREMSD